MGGLLYLWLSQLLLAVGTWYTSRDPCYCLVYGAKNELLNGYYRGDTAMYFHIDSYKYSIFANVFEIFSLRRRYDPKYGILFEGGVWQLRSKDGSEAYYSNAPGAFTTSSNSGDASSTQSASSAPSGGWMTNPPSTKGPEYDTINIRCKGTLKENQSISPRASSNIEYLMFHPFTTIIITLITGYSYYLFDKKIEVSAVSFSYAACIRQREYWRIITASFAHFDYMHFGFNAMSVYQLAPLETIYGSLTFGYLSFALIFITIGICALVAHIVVARGNDQYAYQQSVGYSCVLFAWMVAMSVRMPTFCPVSFLPQLCFATYHLPIPFTVSPETHLPMSIPLNAGPIVLLFITKIIIPRSSFLGHLSGIVIGFPLAWNALNWLTPPVLFALGVVWICWQHELWFHRLQYSLSTASYNAVSEFVEAVEMTKYKYFLTVAGLTCFMTVCLFYLAAMVTISYSNYLLELFVRVVFGYLLVGAAHSRICLWYWDVREPAAVCKQLLVLAVAMCAMMSVYDIVNCAATFTASPLLDAAAGAGIGLTSQTMMILWLLLALFESLLCVCLLLMCIDIAQVNPWLKYVNMDENAVVSDLTTCYLQPALQQVGLMRQSAMSRFSFVGSGQRLEMIAGTNYNSNSNSSSGGGSGSGGSGATTSSSSGRATADMADAVYGDRDPESQGLLMQPIPQSQSFQSSQQPSKSSVNSSRIAAYSNSVKSPTNPKK
jgi:membrane associated rhomboid family serine protease/uncharacterized membrane protein YgcG